MSPKNMLVIFFVCLLLGSCSHERVESTPKDINRELMMIEENLQLKQKVSALEEKVKMIQKEEKLAYTADIEVYQFFRAIQEKNEHEIKKRVTKEARIGETGIEFQNGHHFSYNKLDSTFHIFHLRLREYDMESKKGKLLYELYKGNAADKKMVLLSVEVIKEQDGWKVQQLNQGI